MSMQSLYIAMTLKTIQKEFQFGRPRTTYHVNWLAVVEVERLITLLCQLCQQSPKIAFITRRLGLEIGRTGFSIFLGDISFFSEYYLYLFGAWIFLFNILEDTNG